MNIVRAIARPCLASVFIWGGIDALRKPHGRAEKASPVLDKIKSATPLPADDVMLVRINSAVQIGAGFMLATSRFPRLASLALAGSLVPTTIAGHAFWNVDSETKPMQKTQFAKNLSVLGGLLLAVADTAGKPSLSWRLHHITTPDVHLGKPDWLPTH